MNNETTQSKPDTMFWVINFKSFSPMRSKTFQSRFFKDGDDSTEQFAIDEILEKARMLGFEFESWSRRRKAMMPQNTP